MSAPQTPPERVSTQPATSSPERHRREPASLRGWLGGFALGLLVGVGMLVGALSARWQQAAGQIDFPNLPHRDLLATSTHGSTKFAVATGPVADDSEGVFFLDYITGELQCKVLYPKMGRIGATFFTNVANDLGVVRGKAPDFVMATGVTNFPRQYGGSNCVVYVADANTGNFAVYGIPWDRSALANNNPLPQPLPMRLLDKGTARTAPVQP